MSRRNCQSDLYVIKFLSILKGGYNLMTFQVPTFMFFKNGNKVDELTGANPQALQVSLPQS